MKNVHPLVSVGLFLQGLLVISTGAARYFYPYEIFFPEPLLIILGISLLVSAAGTVMLIQGKAEGGIVGMVGCVLFIPLGFVAGVGFMRSRGLLIQAALRDLEPGGASGARSSSPVNEGAGEREKGRDANSPIHSATPDESSPADVSGPEVAFVAYPFALAGTSARVQNALFIVFGLIVLALVPAYSVLWFAVAGMRFYHANRLKQKSVFAFHSEGMACTPGVWTEEVYVPYGAIGAVKMGWLSATMTVKMPDGSDAKLKVLFSAIASGQRDEARKVFCERMDGLGVPVTE